MKEGKWNNKGLDLAEKQEKGRSMDKEKQEASFSEQEIKRWTEMEL